MFGVLTAISMEIHVFLWGGYEAVRIGLRVVGLPKTEEGGKTLLRNMDKDLPGYKVLCSRRFETL
jgi:hypothetical protein